MMMMSLVLATTLAQVAPPAVPATEASSPVILDNGACLDSTGVVPHVLQPPVVQAMQIVRIDEVVSTATMTAGQIIGYLYTLADGSTWLGQRRQEYMSAADAAAINTVLASTHLPGEQVNAFPPVRKYGVETNYRRYFRVKIPPDALQALKIRLVPCVQWPSAAVLPDPQP